MVIGQLQAETSWWKEVAAESHSEDQRAGGEPERDWGLGPDMPFRDMSPVTASSSQAPPPGTFAMKSSVY